MIMCTGSVPMPVVAPRPPQPGVPAALGPRPGGGPTMSPISAGASDQEKVNHRENISVKYILNYRASCHNHTLDMHCI